jgi:hypothetical protein
LNWKHFFSAARGNTSTNAWSLLLARHEPSKPGDHEHKVIAWQKRFDALRELIVVLTLADTAVSHKHRLSAVEIPGLEKPDFLQFTRHLSSWRINPHCQR